MQVAGLTVVPREIWEPAALQHHLIVDEFTEGVRARKGVGLRHPIEDFLWDYYSLRPNRLRRWHPGFGTEIADADEYASWRGYQVNSGIARIDPAFIEDRREAFTWIADLLAAISAREPRFGCFGLHEWAMVYQLEQSEVRHETSPLRLSRAEIAEIVEAQELKCTHFDAFRFYVPAARSLNHLLLTREGQLANEQGGCLHTNMDLYKWAYKTSPLISSELTLRCFELARRVRTLDMQAAPYDLAVWGLAPVKIETVEGRTEYVRQQRRFAAEAQLLRDLLRKQINAALGRVD